MRKALLAGLAAAALTLSGCAAGTEEVVDEVEEIVVEEVETEAVEEETVVEEGPGTIVDVAVAADDFNTLVAAVTAAGLVDTLSGDGPVTVFAPTDEAFAALPPGLVEALLEEENLDILVQILTYHVVSGAVFAADVVERGSGDVASVEGSAIAVVVNEDGTVTVNDANVVTVDIEASNGVIHVIDAVILPPGVDVNALLG
jgi:uncharacterized surface protein with fasciclin (FAS1) repeats